MRPQLDYEKIFQSSPTPYVVLGRQFDMLAVNAARLRVTNMQRENVIGQPLFDIFPDNPDDPMANGVCNLSASLQRVLETKSMDVMPVQKYDIRQAYGRINLFEERYWSPVNWPVLDSDGNVAQIVHQVVDVTDFIHIRSLQTDISDTEAMGKRIQELEVEMFVRSRERMEAVEKLRESEERYRALVYASSHMLYRMSPDWREMRQLHGGEFMINMDTPNRHWTEVYIHPDDRHQISAAIDRAVSTGMTFELEHRVRRIDGAVGWTYSRAVPVRNQAGEIVEWFGSASDITDRKKAELQLHASEEKYRTLFSNMTEGFALGEPILDDQGRGVDLLWLDANDAFYTQTGLRHGIVGQLVGKYLPGLAKPWIERLTVVALTGQPDHLENFDPITQRHYDAHAFCPSPGKVAIVVRDVTQAKRTWDAFQESERRLALALSASGSAVWEVDVPTGIVKGEDKVYPMVGYTANEIKNLEDWLSIVDPSDVVSLRDLISGLIDGRRDKYSFEARLKTKSGELRWVFWQAVVAERDARGRALKVVGTHTDITDRKLAEQRVREAALHDTLTGLPNRELVFELGAQLLAGVKRTHTHGAMLFIDLDRFKPINDLYGHHIGDMALQEVAKRIVGCTRAADLVGRLGGDEFVILLTHLDTNRERAAIVAQHVVSSISKPYRIGAFELSLSPSIGISYYPEHGSDIGSLIHTADLAMYQSKQSGRSSYRFYTADLDLRARTAYSLEARLKHALAHDQLALHYQPVVDINSGQLTGVEALLRLDDNKHPVSGPTEFIPVAESSGLIGDLGEWVIREACRQHEAWLTEGLRINIAINVSPIQLQRGFPEMLSMILAQTAVDPRCLQLEVTETALMQSLSEGIEILARVKSLGIKIALDDFGTGYSSLSQLSSLPIDKLKVDQSFVRSIESDQASRAVIEAIIALGRSLKLEVIGEGVESEQTLRYLHEHGCNQAQGYWFSEPLPASQFTNWYQRHRLH